MTEPVLEAAPDGVVSVRGELVFGSVAGLLERSAETLFAGQGDGPLVVDLGAVSHADSAGLALLLEWAEMAQARGRELAYRGIPESLLRIARLSNAEALLPSEA